MGCDRGTLLLDVTASGFCNIHTIVVTVVKSVTTVKAKDFFIIIQIMYSQKLLKI